MPLDSVHRAVLPALAEFLEETAGILVCVPHPTAPGRRSNFSRFVDTEAEREGGGRKGGMKGARRRVSEQEKERERGREAGNRTQTEADSVHLPD